ncbi:hypothetical protein GGR50DRAFT_506208 [Xylaria sp. CBS 124048]|nr:hypothetical protein GGR50DRAFT_506208 [Xylaria sp. CBS 124048]
MTSIKEPPTSPAGGLPTTSEPIPWRLDIDGQWPSPPQSGMDDQGTEVPPREIDTISIDSSESIPDFSGRRMMTLEEENAVAYEAWELVQIPDRITRQSTRSFCGINFSSTWRNERNGITLINAVLPFSQDDLAKKHEDAIREFKHRRDVDQGRAYEQDLANRAYKLPFEIYDEVQHLMEDKVVATNRNPHRRREWRVAVLEEREFRMTELLPQRKRKHFFTRERRPPATRAWLVIIRGEEVKSNKECGGWKVYDRRTNPWWRLDNHETKEERGRYKAFMKKMDKVNSLRAGRHPAPPIGPFAAPPARPVIVR